MAQPGEIFIPIVYFCRLRAAEFLGRAIRGKPIWDISPENGHVETVVLLSKGEIQSKKIRVDFLLEDMDMSGFRKGATYQEIKDYVKEQTGLSVSSLYVRLARRKAIILKTAVFLFRN